MKWGRTDRPADQPQDGAARDAARPGSYVGNVLGCCAKGKRPACEDLIADRRVVKLRPVPQEPCRRREEPASVQGALRPEPAPYSIRWCPRAEAQRRIALGDPSSEPASEEQCSTPRPAHAAGRRLSLVERRRESRARSVRPLRVGDGPSRFLGTKRWKKPETASIIARTDERSEGVGRGNRPPTPKLLAPT